MKMNIKEQKLLQAIEECNKHIKRLLYAHHKMSRFMPLNGDQYDNLTDEQVENIDQFIFRFSKLQDAMGERLFRNVLLLLEEEVKNKPFLDLLNRLEQLRIIGDKEQWLALRKLRNDFSHEYLNESDANALNINLVYEQTKKLYDIFRQVKTFLTENTSLLNSDLAENYVLETPLYESSN